MPSWHRNHELPPGLTAPLWHGLPPLWHGLLTVPPGLTAGLPRPTWRVGFRGDLRSAAVRVASGGVYPRRDEPGGSLHPLAKRSSYCRVIMSLTQRLKSRSSSLRPGNGMGLKSPAAISRVRRSNACTRRVSR